MGRSACTHGVVYGSHDHALDTPSPEFTQRVGQRERSRGKTRRPQEGRGAGGADSRTASEPRNSRSLAIPERRYSAQVVLLDAAVGGHGKSHAAGFARNFHRARDRSAQSLRAQAASTGGKTRERHSTAAQYGEIT